MSTNTRSQTLAGSNIQALANLNDEQLGSLRNEFGLSTVQDLALLETSDFQGAVKTRISDTRSLTR